MDVNFQQFDNLLRLISERQDDSQLLNGISTSVKEHNKIYELEFNQVQQSLRQIGFKIIALKKQDKQRIEEENRSIESILRIPSLNLPERMFIYRFCHSLIKIFRPEMQIIRFNQKDSRDILLMFKQFFMAENNFEQIHVIQSLLEQEFKVHFIFKKEVSTCIMLVKILINKSREHFSQLLQSTSSIIIEKIKSKIQEHNEKQITESHQATEQMDSPTSEKPRLVLIRKSPVKRQTSERKPTTMICRSVSVLETKSQPNLDQKQSHIISQSDKAQIPQSFDKIPDKFSDKLQLPQELQFNNPEKQLRYQLRLEQRRLRKIMVNCYKVMYDIDTDHLQCSHIVLKKKYRKHPEQYLQIRGGFFILTQLKYNNSYIRQTLQNYYFQATRQIMRDRINLDQIQYIHFLYNPKPPQNTILPTLNLGTQSPQKSQNQSSSQIVLPSLNMMLKRESLNSILRQGSCSPNRIGKSFTHKD